MNNILLIQSELLKALGMTMIHSIWEAALILIPVLLLSGLIKKDNARLRYIVLYTGLMAMLALFIITFLHVFHSFASLQSSGNTILVSVSSKAQNFAGISDLAITGSFIKNLPQWVMKSLDPVAPVLAIIWFIGFAMTGTRLFAGLYISHIFVNNNSMQPGPLLQEKFDKVRKLLHVPALVQLKLSARKISPMVIGILKPAIIVPIAAISNLGPAQTDAILAHELAHIKRYDHLLLLIQEFAELILFFHPVTWYLSSGIKREREHCCDDLVLKTYTDPIIYIKALTMIQEMNLAGMSPANAVISKPKRMLARVKRLIQPEFNHSAIPRIAIFVILLVSAGALLAATIGMQGKPQDLQNQLSALSLYPDSYIQPADSSVTEISVIVKTDDSRQDTSIVRVERQIIRSGDNVDKKELGEKEIIIRMSNDTISEMTVNGKSVPPDEYEYYTDSIEIFRYKMIRSENGFHIIEVDEILDSLYRDMHNKEYEQFMQQYKDQLEKIREQSKLAHEEALKITEEQLQKARQQADLSRQRADQAREQADRAREQMEKAQSESQYARQEMQEKLKQVQEEMFREQKEYQQLFEEYNDQLSDSLLNDFWPQHDIFSSPMTSDQIYVIPSLPQLADPLFVLPPIDETEKPKYYGIQDIFDDATETDPAKIIEMESTLKELEK